MSNNDLSKKALVNTYYDSSVNKLYQVNADGTKGSEIKMSGIPKLNYTTPLHTFNSSGSYTIPNNVERAYIMGTMGGSAQNISINGTAISNTANGLTVGLGLIQVTAGDTITVSTVSGYPIHVLTELS